jgi:hypothetical protein
MSFARIRIVGITNKPNKLRTFRKSPTNVIPNKYTDLYNLLLSKLNTFSIIIAYTYLYYTKYIL